MNRASGDIGREAVYAAEAAAFEGTSLESLMPFADLAGLARSIVARPWWPHGPIEMVPARRDANSSSARTVGRGATVVRLAAPQFTPATVVHEFAHVLAGVAAGHGECFRRAHVDLVGSEFGSQSARWLIDAYHDMGLGLGPRTWPEPPPPGVAGDGFVMAG